MAKQLLGKEVVAALNERIIAKAEALKANGVTPTLGIVRVGENESDLLMKEEQQNAAKNWVWNIKNICCRQMRHRSRFWQ